MVVLPAAADDILFNVVTTVELYLYDYDSNTLIIIMTVLALS